MAANKHIFEFRRNTTFDKKNLDELALDKMSLDELGINPLYIPVFQPQASSGIKCLLWKVG